MTTDRLTLTPVNLDENIRVLRDFRSMLKSSMGPEGCSKALVTGGDVLQLTATSSSLLARVELEHPICRYIGQVASGLPDLGLYFGVMVSHLVEQLWAQESIPKQKVSSNIHCLLEFVQEVLTSDLVSKKVDFSTINSFLPLVRTVISSKCCSLLFDVNIDSFCFEIIKAFLNCIDDKTNSVGRVFVKVETGPNMICSHNGLLYKVTEDHDLEVIKKLKGQVKVLIFTIKLDNSNDSSEISLVDKVMAILEQAVKRNVKIVACQKTVAPEIKVFLIRRQVVLMDRMGTDLTESLLHCSQGFRISHVNDLPDVGQLFGTITLVEAVQFNDSNYILLQNKDTSIATLLIENYCLAGTEHLTEREKDKDFQTMALWLQRALLSACGPAPPSSLDSVYHHAWANEGSRCRCGLVSVAEMGEAGGLLIPLEELVTSHCARSVTLKSPKRTKELAVYPDVLVDSHQQKLTVIVSVFETFANISDIGSILYSN